MAWEIEAAVTLRLAERQRSLCGICICAASDFIHQHPAVRVEVGFLCEHWEETFRGVADTEGPPS